jgi:hypothetical protein
MHSKASQRGPKTAASLRFFGTCWQCYVLKRKFELSDIKDFLQKKIESKNMNKALKQCELTEVGNAVKCCSCEVVSPIEGNWEPTGMNTDETGACKTIFTCPNCKHECCLDRNGYKLKLKKKSKLRH